MTDSRWIGLQVSVKPCLHAGCRCVRLTFTNALKSDLKKTRICPIWANLTHFGAKPTIPGRDRGWRRCVVVITNQVIETKQRSTFTLNKDLLSLLHSSRVDTVYTGFTQVMGRHLGISLTT